MKSREQITALLSQAASEPRLKGSFPIEPYQSILLSSQRLLDLLSSTSVRSFNTDKLREFVTPIQIERRAMVSTSSQSSRPAIA
jgi:hypothetical protein